MTMKKFILALGCISALTMYSALAHADQVINDDLIVTQSQCVGQDCVNGENFGFDTLRLKENNLQIHFDDTSNSASFPQNDWRIIINESTNGGQNKFSIQDATAGRIPFTIEAGAQAHALYLDSNRVGLGTSTPVVELHIQDGDTPTLRLQQDGSSGFTQQTWDVAGNEAGFFVRDVTNGSSLRFRILPGASGDSLVVHGSGRIGIGTLTPDGNLDIDNGASNATLVLSQSGATPTQWQFTNNQTTGRLAIHAPNGGGATTGVIKIAPNAVENLMRLGFGAGGGHKYRQHRWRPGGRRHHQPGLRLYTRVRSRINRSPCRVHVAKPAPAGGRTGAGQ